MKYLGVSIFMYCAGHLMIPFTLETLFLQFWGNFHFLFSHSETPIIPMLDPPDCSSDFVIVSVLFSIYLFIYFKLENQHLLIDLGIKEVFLKSSSDTIT